MITCNGIVVVSQFLGEYFQGKGYKIDLGFSLSALDSQSAMNVEETWSKIMDIMYNQGRVILMGNMGCSRVRGPRDNFVPYNTELSRMKGIREVFRMNDIRDAVHPIFAGLCRMTT